jgi:hypothetical protein
MRGSSHRPVVSAGAYRVVVSTIIWEENHTSPQENGGTGRFGFREPTAAWEANRGRSARLPR